MNPIKNFTIERAAEIYREWLNNFLTIGAYADYQGWDDEETAKIIRIGKIAHEEGY